MVIYFENKIGGLDVPLEHLDSNFLLDLELFFGYKIEKVNFQGKSYPRAHFELDALLATREELEAEEIG